MYFFLQNLPNIVFKDQFVAPHFVSGGLVGFSHLVLKIFDNFQGGGANNTKQNWSK